MSPLRPGTFTLVAFAGELSLILVAWLAVWLWPEPPLLIPEWDLEALLWGALAALPPLSLLFWMLSPGGQDLEFVGRIRSVLSEHIGGTVASLQLWQMALIALAAGIGEEVLFRGALQPRMGLLLTSLLFGLLHPFTLAYAVIVTAFGLYLGWLQEKGGNLLLPITTHAIYDFVALWAVRRDLRRGESEGGPAEGPQRDSGP